MDIPSHLFYTKDHEWICKDGDVMMIGITDFAQQQLTDVVFVELPKVGAHLEKGKTAAVIESVKSVSDVFAPLSGEVVLVNDALLSSPQLLNEDPYGKGWMFKMKTLEIPHLLSAKEYEALSCKGH